MDERTPDNQEEHGAEMAADTPPRTTTPNPHAGEPVPPPEEGLRPEADADVVRPAEEEPNGPVGGLIHTAATEVAAEVSDSSEAHAEAARLGVEEEGVEAGQLIGLVAATIIAVGCLVLALFYIFYLPTLNTTQSEQADVPEDRYVELRENRAEAFDKISQYATAPEGDGVYQIPIEAAMAQIANAEVTPVGDAPITRSQFNTSWMQLHPAPAVAAGTPTTGGPAAETPASGDETAPPVTMEEEAPAPVAPAPEPEEPPQE